MIGVCCPLERLEAEAWSFPFGCLLLLVGQTPGFDVHGDACAGGGSDGDSGVSGIFGRNVTVSGCS